MTKTHKSYSAMAVLVCGLILVAQTLPQSPEWSQLKKEIRETFPTVRQLTILDFARLRQSASEKPVILDIREKEEYEVSHLLGARNVPPGNPVGSLELPQDRTIVCYCSVGYRSSEMAAQLQEAGYTKVYNLEGSIFEWVNTGRKVVDAQGTTKKVHGFDLEWSKLLKPEFRWL